MEKGTRLEDKKGPCVVCFERGCGLFPIVSSLYDNFRSYADTWHLCQSHHNERRECNLVQFAGRHPGAREELKARGFTEVAKEAEKIFADIAEIYF
jgi:hypothetical protein